MKKTFLLILLSTISLLFLPLQGMTFNKNLAQFNIYENCGTIAVAVDTTTKHKCTSKHLNEELPYQIKTIVIDAGHGGHDPGCSGPNSVEKHLALAIAKKFATAVENKYPDITVILTRDKDIFIPLYERAAIANRAKADLFVSIHCNALPSSKATWGSETYVMGLHTAEHNLDVAKRENDAILLEADYEQNYEYDPNSPEGHILLSMYQNAFLEQSIQFAERVEYHFHTTAKRKSRGVKQAGFVVLKETAMPSALVEVGFLTSAKDEAYFKTEKGQNTAAGALLNAFRDYKILVEENDDEPIAFTNSNTQHQHFPTKLEDTPKPKSLDKPMAENRETSGSPYYQEKGNYTTPTVPPATDVQASTTAVQAGRLIQPSSSSILSTRSQPVAVQERATQSNITNNNTNVNFSVQIAAAPKPLNTKQGPWLATDYLIEVIQEDNLFKYQVKNIHSLDQAFETRIQLQTKGFNDAFIVCYQDGQRITMEEARRLLGE